MARLTKNDFLRMHSDKNEATMVVLYDYSFAKAAEAAGVDAILVGDSVGMVSLGLNSTTPVTLDEMITFCSAVTRGAKDTFVIGDMPFGSYEISDQIAIESSIRLIKEGSVNAVKLEGGLRIASRIKAINSANIPIMGHLGVTPQTSVGVAGYKPYGKTKKQILQLKTDMEAIEESGAYSILLEGIPGELSEIAKSWVSIPIYGIGSGPNVDGQLLLAYDLLGLFPDFKPKFAKSFMQEVLTNAKLEGNLDLTMYQLITKVFELYKKSVNLKEFPSLKETYSLSTESNELIEYAVSL